MTTFTTFKKWEVGALVTCAFLGIGLSQTISSPRNGRPTTVAEKLQKRGVSLSREGLVLALRSEDPEVRFLAAEQLAYQGAKDTIPNMQDALKRENSSLAKINIGYALAQMEDQVGFETLQEGCSNDKLAPNLRLMATRYLLDLHRNDCIRTVLNVLQNADNPADRMRALSLLPRFEPLSEDDSARVTGLVLAALQDPTPAVRISAGEVIARIGGKTAEEYVKAAADHEGDEVVRSQLQADLRRLQKKYEEK